MNFNDIYFSEKRGTSVKAEIIASNNFKNNFAVLNSNPTTF